MPDDVVAERGTRVLIRQRHPAQGEAHQARETVQTKEGLLLDLLACITAHLLRFASPGELAQVLV